MVLEFLVGVQFEYSMNHNEHESISRKGAKRRREESFQDKLSLNTFASFLCVFAPLRETFLSAYETEPLLNF
jgi:hypothetical protein